MAAAMVPKLYEQSLQSAACELNYERSTHSVDIIAKDEDLRRLRFDVHVLEDDNDELRELLTQEENRSDAFEKLISENLARAEAAEAQLQESEDRLRAKEREVGTLHAEARALQTSAADSEAFLTEKLALTRELSILRPQLEHLRVQAASTETLTAEKLDLQRQLTEFQCELENAKRDAKRAMAKRRNTGVEIARDQELEDLKRELAKEQRARQRAEEAADVTQNDINVDDVRKELAREKRARQKVEEELEAAQDNTQLEHVRRDLLKEKKAKQRLENSLEDLQQELEKEKRDAARAAKRANGDAEANEQTEELRQQLAVEKKERSKVERQAQKAADEFEAQRATLEEKVGQFRSKLKTTKDKLKEVEAELIAAKSTRAADALQNGKKRSAAQFDVDATNLGTPGDGPAMKRGRRAGAGAFCDKSTFSITPFLNKTISVAPASPDSEASEAEVASPVAAAKDTEKPKPALATISASEANVQKKTTGPRQRKQKPVAAPALEMVSEEAEDIHAQGQENNGKAVTKVKTKTGDGPEKAADDGQQKRRKARKSLADFASFAAEPEPEKKQKKRKLGGLGKTLFDDEDENVAPPAKGLATGRGLFGGRGFGALAAGSKKAGGFLGSSRVGSTLLTAADGSGFQFSPLKRSRKNLDDTLRG